LNFVNIHFIFVKQISNVCFHKDCGITIYLLQDISPSLASMICFTPQQVAFEKGYASYTV